MSELDPRQFDEWYAFYQLDPWGPERDDLRTALFACALETLERTDPVWQIGDFMPYSDQLQDADTEPSPWDGAQSSEMQAELWRLMAARYEP